MSEIPQAPAPSLDARGQWLTPECQHTIPKLLRLAAPHIPPLAAAFVRDMHAAADRLDAAPSAPSDALRDELVFVQGCVVRAAHGLAMALKGEGLNGADLEETATGVSAGLMGVDSRISAALAALDAPTAPKEPQR